MLPFGVTIPATVPQGSEIPEGLMNNPVYIYIYIQTQLNDFIKVYFLVCVVQLHVSAPVMSHLQVDYFS